MSKRSSVSAQRAPQEGQEGESRVAVNSRSETIPNAPPSDPETVYRPAAEVRRMSMNIGTTIMTRVDYIR